MDTNDFVKKFNETKKKDHQNKKRQGHDDPSKKLPNKRH
ncbi:DUF4023 domain-containing protein [Virgibacillus indicus]|uniref:DUF4023 domain-containing protein n=1 Tax=Virgibacillus indicus TaxID=2024554 RepID=A0A265NBZ1_9BACI|nr:DUF4023 family protein [Virgibacillus indicus]OZU89337.1 DUF4023 domain-containing protein [Virgibacillus indicus]